MPIVHAEQQWPVSVAPPGLHSKMCGFPPGGVRLLRRRTLPGAIFPASLRDALPARSASPEQHQSLCGLQQRGRRRSEKGGARGYSNSETAVNRAASRAFDGTIPLLSWSGSCVRSRRIRAVDWVGAICKRPTRSVVAPISRLRERGFPYRLVADAGRLRR
jgi:hypothetical protein